MFNVLTENNDDHVKNFSFICREGKWSLAPAYDLTLCKEGYHGEHATSANNKGNPDIEDMLAVGESIRIPRRKGMEIINHMINHCQEILSTRFEQLPLQFSLSKQHDGTPTYHTYRRKFELRYPADNVLSDNG